MVIEVTDTTEQKSSEKQRRRDEDVLRLVIDTTEQKSSENLAQPQGREISRLGERAPYNR